MDRKYRKIGPATVCPDCGAIVVDPKVHDRFHDAVETFARREVARVKGGRLIG
jgi:hypothetical protein